MPDKLDQPPPPRKKKHLCKHRRYSLAHDKTAIKYVAIRVRVDALAVSLAVATVLANIPAAIVVLEAPSLQGNFVGHVARLRKRSLGNVPAHLLLVHTSLSSHQSHHLELRLLSTSNSLLRPRRGLQNISN